MKRLLVLFALAAACLAVAGSVWAYVTPPSDPSHNHSLGLCTYYTPSRVIGGSQDPHHPILAGDPIYLTIGWGTHTQVQANDFLSKQYGSITVHQGSPTGTVVASVGPWATGDTTYWTAPAKVSFPPGTPGPLPSWQTKMFWQVTPSTGSGLASGTYYVDFDIELSARVNDGLNNYGPGQMPGFTGTGCELDVQ